jgi:hypothetical protein
MFAALNSFLTRAVSGYFLNKSLRFRSSASAYLNRTPATATNQTTWTWSAWVKRGALADGTLFSAGVSSQPYATLAFSSNQLVFDCINSGPVVVGRKYTNALYRDPAAWYHVVAVWNTTNGTAGNRMLLYVNGEQVTSFSLSTDPASSATTQVNSTVAHQLGQFLSAGSYFDGELAEVNFVDGQALAPTAFGATGANSQWLPKAYTGTYGTNGFYLPFTNTTSTSTLVADSSGNANNWTPNNISLTAGSTYDSLTDVPTLTSETVANYAVWNPLVTPFHYSLQDANLTAVASAGSTTYGFAKGTVAIPIGATDGIYWEIVWTFSASWVSGLGVMEASRTDYTGVGAYGEFSTTPNSIAVSNAYNSGGQVYVTQNSANVFTSASGVLTSGSTMMFALKNGKFYIGINGTWLNSGVPASGTGYMGAVMTADLVPAAQFAYPATTFFANFGQQPFVYTPPSGFLPLNTFNIAAGTVTTSGTFTGNLSTDGPFVFLNGTPTAMTINGNAVTFGTQADKLANGFKVRSSSALYNLIGSNTYVATTVAEVLKYENAQPNP